MKICCGTVNRGLAVYKNTLYLTTLDAHLVALEMTTGKVVWGVPISAGRGYLVGRELGARRRSDVADRQLRSCAQSRVLGHG